ncbi:hypothetical protein [Rhizobium leguminosarum]|uniref:hypothetical protein n=1 Tax=Rhizobium leguminosarum TaxID=384 RepID=UPI00144233FF|nr:hypothetical protein [Rhizobium leguminosarum]NKJ77741.1 hypothetical protein [Rhizobium leguminosarum bv. viciae]
MTDNLLKRVQARFGYTATNTMTAPRSEASPSWYPSHYEAELPRQRGVEIPDFQLPAEPILSKTIMKSTPVDFEPQPQLKEALDWMTGTRFQVGDIVTRDGTDRQRIVEIGEHSDIMLVECIKAPLGYRNEDGSRDKPWCQVGEQEWNLPRRYSYPDDLEIEGDVA